MRHIARWIVIFGSQRIPGNVELQGQVRAGGNPLDGGYHHSSVVAQNDDLAPQFD